MTQQTSSFSPLSGCPSYKGCCDGPEWRGRLCQYHQGWLDGYEAHRSPLEYVGEFVDTIPREDW